MNSFNFDDLYEKHHAEINRFCFSMIGDFEDAKELTNEIFVKAYFSYDPSQNASFRTYIFHIAKNLCIDFRRSRGYKQKKVTEQLSEHHSKHNSVNIGDSLEQDENMKALNSCLDALNYEEKVAVRLYHIEEFTYQHISEIIGKSMSTVKNRIRAALKNLKKCLQRKGFDI